MAGTILTGGAGSGKTTFIIEAILRAESEGFWREVWVLLPTRLQSEAFRDQLIRQAAGSAIFNIHVFEFYELYARLLDLAGSPQRTISQAASDRILRHIIGELQATGGLLYYEQIAQQAGFVQLVSSFIKELKQALVEPETFTDYAVQRSDKDRDLALIYDFYQRFLRENNLIDRDGAGWVALELLRSDPSLVENVALLAVDGFDDFNLLQIHLLTQLTRHIQPSYLTLTYEDHRRSDAARTFSRTLTRLQSIGDWTIQAHPILAELPRQPALSYLERHLFEIDPPPIPADEQLHLIEAPDPNSETQAVLRRVKGLLLEGVEPEQIAVVVRDADLYLDALRRTAHAYRLPVVIRRAEPLIQNPAVRTVLGLLDLHALDFPRRQMLDLLHSPYLDAPDFTSEQIACLERISLDKPIVRGRENWLAGLEKAALPDDNEDEEGYLSIPPAEAAALRRATESFFDRLTPPREATARDYVHWIEGLLGSDPEAGRNDLAEGLLESEPEPRKDFNLYNNLRNHVDDGVIVRDVYAMLGLRAALRDVIAAYDLLADVAHQRQPILISWDIFRADLELAIKQRTISDQSARSRAGRVLITTVFEARGLPHDYLFLMGLSEGIFPQRQNEDPLYGDQERRHLAQNGIPLETAADRARDTSLFYEMCALAQTRLTLSRPTIDESGNEWSPSIFWKHVLAILQQPNRQHIRLGAVPLLKDAANRRELLVSLSDALGKPPDHISSMAWDALRWVRQQGIWENLLRGRGIELSRESAQTPFDTYSGILTEPALIAEVGRQLGTDRRWSATQFNELGVCPFRFFGKRILKLEPYEEPEEGLTIQQFGTVNHRILELTYQRLAEEGIAIVPPNTEHALDVLREEAERVFQTAPQEFGFQVTPVWEQEKANLLRKLENLVRLDFSQDNPTRKLVNEGEVRRPLRQEADFTASPLVLQGAAGSLRVGGVIDRLDEIGNSVIVMDYKSGSHTPSKEDMEEGRNFQMLLYLLAAKQMGYRVRGGLFWSIQKNKAEGMVKFEDEAVQAAHDLLHRAVLAARGGRFPNQPRKLENGHCVHYCEFRQFCRLSRNSQRKPVS
jgi:ATP-dependent helicase/DNAse subunit B